MMQKLCAMMFLPSQRASSLLLARRVGVLLWYLKAVCCIKVGLKADAEECADSKKVWRNSNKAIKVFLHNIILCLLRWKIDEIIIFNKSISSQSEKKPTETTLQ
jgi:hypothetical protein